MVGSPRNLPKGVVPAVARSSKSLFGPLRTHLWRSGKPDPLHSRPPNLEGGHRGVRRGRPLCTPGGVDPPIVAVPSRTFRDPGTSTGCRLGRESSELELPLGEPSACLGLEGGEIASWGRVPRERTYRWTGPVGVGVLAAGLELSSLVLTTGRQSSVAGARHPAGSSFPCLL
jgi:hypothetical protein